MMIRKKRQKAATSVVSQPKLMDRICERLAGGESLRAICADKDMPDRVTVFRWLAKSPALQAQYAHARDLQADALFDEMLDIADDARNDFMERLGDDGSAQGWRENGEAAKRSALRIDARKWMLAKMQPKKYGDKIDVNHGVTDGLTQLLEAVDGRTRGLPNSR